MKVANSMEAMPVIEAVDAARRQSNTTIAFLRELHDLGYAVIECKRVEPAPPTWTNIDGHELHCPAVAEPDTPGAICTCRARRL